jgi:hypothetical protein
MSVSGPSVAQCAATKCPLTKVEQKSHAAISAWCAEQTASAKAAAALRYLEQMWLLVADVAEIIERNRSRSVLGSDLPHLSPE